LLVSISGSAHAFCGPVQLKFLGDNIPWCAEQCNVPNSQTQCSGAGEMSNGARNGDANAIREGYEFCHQLDTEIIEACARDNPAGLISLVRSIDHIVPSKNSKVAPKS